MESQMELNIMESLENLEHADDHMNKNSSIVVYIFSPSANNTINK